MKTPEGIIIPTNHHRNCPRYNDSLMDVWVVVVDGVKCVVDNEADARETAGTDGGAVVTQRKMHKEVFDNLRDFEGL